MKWHRYNIDRYSITIERTQKLHRGVIRTAQSYNGRDRCEVIVHRFRKRVFRGILIANSKSPVFSVERNSLLPWRRDCRGGLLKLT